MAENMNVSEMKNPINMETGNARGRSQLEATIGGNITHCLDSIVFKLKNGGVLTPKEENARLAARQQKFIASLEAALIRIENKTYGVCRETGKLIAKERLRLVPHATLSIDAKIQQNKPKSIFHKVVEQ